MSPPLGSSHRVAFLPTATTANGRSSMSPGSAQGHIATATARYSSTIASIGLRTRDAAGRESSAAILARLPDGAGNGIHRDAASVDPWHAPVTPTRGGLAPWQ